MRAAEALVSGIIALAAATASAQTLDRNAALAFLLLLNQSAESHAAIALDLEGLEFDLRDADMATPLHRAAEFSRDPALIDALVAHGADLEARDARGRTPLRAAERNPVAAAALIAAGADACEPDVSGRPSLSAETLERIRLQAPDGYAAAQQAFIGCL
jgi:hypothetical protein